MVNQKIALVGSTGRLGSTLMELYEDEIIPTDFRVQHFCDVEDWIFKHRQEVSKVIYAAGKTNVCDAEEFPIETFKVNTIGAYHVARAFNARGKEMIYISTDHVFDGIDGLYYEDDYPNPIGNYAMSKFLGEEATIVTSNYNLVIRTSFLKEFELPRAFIDKFFSGDLVEIIADEIWMVTKLEPRQRDYESILHIGTGRHSIYEIAKKINPDVLPMLLQDNPKNKVGLFYLRDTSLNSETWEYYKEKYYGA